MLVSYPFTLKNISSSDLLNIILDLSACTLPIKHCTVIRQRGTLSYEQPLIPIQLGNFYPDESCSLIFTLTDDASPLDTAFLSNCFSAMYLTSPPALTPTLLDPSTLLTHLLLTPSIEQTSFL